MIFLKAIRILDEDGTLSFTSLYLYLGLGLCIFTPVSPYLVALLTLILAHTNLKRFSRFKAKEASDALNVKNKEIEASKGKAEEDMAVRVSQIESELQKIITTNNFSRLSK